jgi:hypothetical protein
VTHRPCGPAPKAAKLPMQALRRCMYRTASRASLRRRLARRCTVRRCAGKGADWADASIGAGSSSQIAYRLPLNFPDDLTMRISHEVIYQAPYMKRTRRPATGGNRLSPYGTHAACAACAHARVWQALCDA